LANDTLQVHDRVLANDRVLIQAAWILKTCCRAPAARKLQLWAAEVEKRRGKGVATVALARKLAGILFALWRDGTEFKSC